MPKKYLKLDEKKFAISCGLVSAIFIAFTTLFAMFNYVHKSKPHHLWCGKFSGFDFGSSKKLTNHTL